MGISLVKGQKISLEKEAGGTLSRIRMGLGWDVAKPKGFFSKLTGGGSIDLDASCVLFDGGKNVVDTVWYAQLRSKDGSVLHTGDNLTGEGEGDDESIILDLPAIPAGVTAIVFTVNSYSGQTFETVENAFCRIVDEASNKEIAKYDLSHCGGKQTAMIMAKLYRHNGEWKFHAIGETSNGRDWQALMPDILPHV